MEMDDPLSSRLDPAWLSMYGASHEVARTAQKVMDMWNQPVLSALRKIQESWEDPSHQVTHSMKQSWVLDAITNMNRKFDEQIRAVNLAQDWSRMLGAADYASRELSQITKSILTLHDYADRMGYRMVEPPLMQDFTRQMKLLHPFDAGMDHEEENKSMSESIGFSVDGSVALSDLTDLDLLNPEDALSRIKDFVEKIVAQVFSLVRITKKEDLGLILAVISLAISVIIPVLQEHSSRVEAATEREQISEAKRQVIEAMKPLLAFASEYRKARVITREARIYLKPGGRVLPMKVTAGTKVQVLEERHEWVAVEFMHDDVLIAGWALKKYTKKFPDDK